MNVGKVYKYDGSIGEIVADNDKYLFTYLGLEENVKVGDLVSFKIRDKDDKLVTDVKPYSNETLQSLIKKYADKK